MDQSPGSEVSIHLLCKPKNHQRNHINSPKNKQNSLSNYITITSNNVYIFLVETIVEPNQKKSVWYHQKFRRVPTIDQCYTDDSVCKFEADQQFRRDRMVDNEILSILRLRFEDCMMYETPDHMVKCRPFMDVYKKAEENWFIKCEFYFYLLIEMN